MSPTKFCDPCYSFYAGDDCPTCPAVPVSPTAEVSPAIAPATQPVAAEPLETASPVEAAATVSSTGDGLRGFEKISLANMAHGYRVFPIRADGKAPHIVGFPKLATATDKARIRDWAVKFPDANCGILATPEGNLLIDEDASSEFRQGYEILYHEPFPVSRTTESRPNHRQSHWIQTDYTRAKLRNITQGKTKDGMFSLRYRNEYVLGEGSRHPKGSIYTVVIDAPAIPMPDRLADYILSLVTIAQQNREGVPYATVANALDAALPPRFDILIYEDDCGPGRNNTVSEYAYDLYQNFTTDPAQLLEMTSEYNSKHCIPALEEWEVKKIVNGKIGLPLHGANTVLIGGNIAGTAPVQQPTTSPVVSALNSADFFGDLKADELVFRDTDDSFDEGTEQPKDWKLLLPVTDFSKTSWIESNVQTADQLSDEPVKWTSEGFLLYQGVNLLCADPGSYKSMVALFASKAIIENVPFMGRAPLGRKLRVVYCDAENPQAVVMERLKGIGLLDRERRPIPGFKIWGRWENQAGTTADFMCDARFEEDAILNPDTFYIFDALSSFTGNEDENDNPEMARIMQQAKKLARICAGVLILHHTSKKGDTAWRGAASIVDQSDHAIAMDRAKMKAPKVPGQKKAKFVKSARHLVRMSEIRFRACTSWDNEIELFFETQHPDGGPVGKTGTYIHYETIKSGLEQGVGFGEGTTLDLPDEVDFTPSDAEIIKTAAGHIADARARGVTLNQTSLARLCGVADGKAKTRIFCADPSRPWRCVPGPRGAILYYNPGEIIPTEAELEEQAVNEKRVRSAERKRKSRGKVDAAA